MKLLEIITVVLFLGVYVVYLPRLIVKHDLKTLKLLILEIVLQNLICIMASDVFGRPITQIIILYKELVMYASVLLFFFNKQKLKIKKYIVPVIVMIAVCIPYFFIGTASLYTRLICFRQIMTPLILILYGRTFKLQEFEKRKALKYIVDLGVIQAIFGLFERFILGDSFWLSMNISKYMDAKGFSAWIYNNGLPGNFYSADLYNYVGMMRRLVGLLTDPLLTGHFLAFCVIILLFIPIYDKRSKNIFALSICSIAIVLTLSKGAMLIIAIGYVYKLWRHNKVFAMITGVIAIGFIAVLVRGDILYTMSRHIGGLTSSFSSEYIIGKGLGSSGNYANLYGGSSETSGESYIGAIIGQMGVVGFIAFIYANTRLLKRIRSCDHSPMSYLVSAYIIAVLIESIISESAINFVGSGVAFILFGLLTSRTQKYSETSTNSISVYT